MLLQCPKCKHDIPSVHYQSNDFFSCEECDSQLKTFVFPALFRDDKPVDSGEKIVIDSHASCFYHEDKQAEVACEMCGRFLCGLCDLEIDNKHICSSCLEAGSSKKQTDKYINHSVRYDDIAFALAIYPIIIFFLTFITAPLTIFYVIRYWNDKSNLIPLSKIKFTIAFIIALAQILGWMMAFGWIKFG